MVLGKRQRETREAKPPGPATALGSDSESDGAVQAIFQRHFEARFKPLDNIRRPPVKVMETEPSMENDDSSEWSGISISDCKDYLSILDQGGLHITQQKKRWKSSNAYHLPNRKYRSLKKSEKPSW